MSVVKLFIPWPLPCSVAIVRWTLACKGVRSPRRSCPKPVDRDGG